ncbi:MAG: hypothetical protein RBR13_00935 [Tenuifilaceae bacterium]|nr:hypothetical protein [Tenuifilaceae bacterium]
MKKTLFYMVLTFFTVGVFGQDFTDKVPSTYNRSSLTVLYLDFESGNHWNLAKSKIDSIVFSDKYDNNNLNSLFIKPSFSTVGRDAILQELNNQDIGREIVAKWYNRKSDGTMDMELVHQRGRFTATDADFLRAQTSKRGNAALEEFGNRLINLSYVLVINVSDIKTMAEAEIKGQKGFQASAAGYLYKIDFTEETRSAFYDTWIYEDDTEAVKIQKRNAFNQIQIPIVPIVNKSINITASQPEGDTGLGLFFKPKSTDQLMQELIQKSFDDLIYRIEMDVEDFKVKTSLASTRPLSAKIGLKEGLKTDYRFFVYEYVYNERTDKVEPKRRGVIRAHSKSKIVDNRKVATGDMEPSRFYQVAGRKLEEGYTLQQKNDFGIEVGIGTEVGEIGGFYVRGDLRVGRFIGIRSTFVLVEAGFDTGTYTSAQYLSPGNPDFSFLRFGIGLAKGFQLMRNLELRAYLSAGAEQASNADLTEDEAVSAVFVKPGANLALNLTHNFQVVGGVGAYAFVSEAQDGYDNLHGMWNTLFTDRSGASIFIGVKLGF